MNRTPYMLAYPGGDRSCVGIFYVKSYQERDWDLASMQRFENVEDAKEYGNELLEGKDIRPLWVDGILGRLYI